MRLVNSHAHLQAPAFADDAAHVLAASRLAGVERLLAPAWDRASTQAGIALARERGVDTSAGVHPHDAASVTDDDWARIEEMAREPEVVAIGETGLDYDRGFSSREAQLANLRRHLGLAPTVAKPLILHCRSKPGERDAQDELLRELGRRRQRGLVIGVRGRPAFVLHSFSGPVDYAERALDLGGAISFCGLVFRRGEEASADVARVVPTDRLLTETDSPYLSPPGAPRRRNEPSWVAVTARWLAHQRTDDPEALGDVLVSTYDRCSGVPGTTRRRRQGPRTEQTSVGSSSPRRRASPRR